MASSFLPAVPDWPENSRPGREIAAHLRMHDRLRIKASIEYEKVVGSEIARRILESTNKAQVDDAATLVDDPVELEQEVKAPTVVDVNLFDTFVHSFASTPADLILAALKPLEEVKAPELDALSKDEKTDAINAFENEIHTHLPTLLATIYKTRVSKTTPSHSNYEELQWITIIDRAMDESVHNHFKAKENIEDHLKMACFAVKYGCRSLKSIAIGLGSWPMVDNAVSSIHTEVVDRQELEELRARSSKWRAGWNIGGS